MSVILLSVNLLTVIILSVSAECHSAQWYSDFFHSVLCHFTWSHYPLCHSAVFYSDKCYSVRCYSDCQSADWQSVDYYSWMFRKLAHWVSSFSVIFNLSFYLVLFYLVSFCWAGNCWVSFCWVSFFCVLFQGYFSRKVLRVTQSKSVITRFSDFLLFKIITGGKCYKSFTIVTYSRSDISYSGRIVGWFHQGILKGEVSLYHWPPVWLVWISLFCK